MSSTPVFTTEAFRLLVDEALQLCKLSNEADVIERFRSKFSTVQPAQRWETLYAIMKADLCVQIAGVSAFTILRRFKKSVVYEDALGHPVDPYAALLRTLADACREGSARPFEEKEFWIDAIQAAQALRVLKGDFPENNLRAAAVLKAAKRLIANGAALRVKEGRFEMDEAELARLAYALDRQVNVLGGLPVVEQVIALLVENESLEFGRYSPGRTFPPGRMNPSFPFGYLLQLGVKHLSSPPALSQFRPALWKDIAQQAIDLCAVLDVEPYDGIENIFLDAAEVPSYLAGVALFDHLFTLKQWPPSRASDLLRGVTDKLDPGEVRSRVGWDLADVFVLLDAILSLAKEPCTIITPQQLEQAGVPQATWLALQPIFVHSPGGMNKKYTLPLDADKAEFDFRPLFGLSRNDLLVVTPGLACLGFYEATTRALRDAGYPNLDTLLGDAVETVVADEFRAAGLNVTIQGVEYVAQGGSWAKPTGECDVIVETDELVVFVELKKKPLRRVSATGDAASGLVDLSSSLFAAQAQLARHERILLRDRELSFVNGYTLKLGKRCIERIAMTWLDYGGLQDKHLLSQIFTKLIGSRVTTDHPKEGDKLNKFNDVISDLETEYAELCKLGKDKSAPFINCWFLSVPQLAMLLDGISQPTEFNMRLSKLRHLTFRALDFYREFGFARRGGLI